MTSENKSILLFKEIDERYSVAFNDSNVRFVPLLTTSTIGAAALREALGDVSASIDALIFTSMRALEVVCDALREDTSLPVDANTRLYALGARQCEFARTHLQINGMFNTTASIQGDNCRNAEELATLVLNSLPSERTSSNVHFLCGEKRMSTIESMLSQDTRVALQVTPLYTTQPVQSLASLDELIDDELRHESSVWIVFFSPSGVEIVATRHPDNRTVAVERTSIACIGKTTASAVVEWFGREPDAVAAEPTPEALAEAINRSNRPAPAPVDQPQSHR